MALKELENSNQRAFTMISGCAELLKHDLDSSKMELTGSKKEIGDERQRKSKMELTGRKREHKAEMAN